MAFSSFTLDIYGWVLPGMQAEDAAGVLATDGTVRGQRGVVQQSDLPAFLKAAQPQAGSTVRARRRRRTSGAYRHKCRHPPPMVT